MAPSRDVISVSENYKNNEFAHAPTTTKAMVASEAFLLVESVFCQAPMKFSSGSKPTG